MANLSVGPRELIGQAVDHGNYGNDSLGIEALAFDVSQTETTGFLLAIGDNRTISDSSQEIGSSTARTFRAIDPATFTGVGTDTVGREQLAFATGTTETTGRLLALTATNDLTTVPAAQQTGGFNTAGVGLVDQGSNTVGLALYPQKAMLFLGNTDGVARTTAAPIAGAQRTYNTFETNKRNYYFIEGIRIDDEDTNSFTTGEGVWTTDDPSVLVSPANSANLIG